jgi:uncharacterized protein YdhG (YjbR/CyaY superfamily)
VTARSASAESVAAYVEALAPEQRRVVKRIRSLVKKEVPGCKEAISYGIPAFRFERTFMYCAAFKAHVGIYPPVTADAALRKAVSPYANAKGNLRFPLDEPIPYPLIARVAKALAKQYAKPATRRAAAGG